MRLHIHHHFFEEELLMANASLAEQLSAVASALLERDETIASLSAALEAGAGSDSSAVSSAVSAAVDAEDTAIAESISTILG